MGQHFVGKKIGLEFLLCKKKIVSGIFWVQKKFVSEIILDKKKLMSEIFWVKKNLGWKFFWSTKFGTEIILGKEI